MSLAEPLPWNLVARGYTDHNLELFEGFARRALELADVEAGERVVDVACGSGALTLLAAGRGANVTAVDFSDEMLGCLRGRLSTVPEHGVQAVKGDGQALPLDASSFDAGFSMFGLIFFPDRSQGFAELRRVLRPGGRAVVSSWLPMGEIPLFRAVFSTVFELAPELAPSEAPSVLPLSSADAYREEMEPAGFEVDVEVVEASVHRETLAALIRPLPYTNAPLALMRNRLGTRRFDEQVWPALMDRLESELGPGPAGFSTRALLAVGTAVS